MGRFRKQMLSVLSIGAATVVSAAGCVDNNASLFIQGVLAPDPPECSVRAQPGSTLLGEGVLDVAFAQEYRAWVLVGNQMTPRGQKQQARAETMRVSLTGAEVRLEDVSGADLGSRTVPGSGFTDVNRSQSPGYGALLTTLIPADLAAGIAGQVGGAGFGAQQTVIANIRVIGETLGGDEIESAELSFPIQVCNGCTIIYPLDAIVDGECAVAGSEATTLPCFAGQGAIDCRACSATNSLCRNVPQ